MQFGLGRNSTDAIFLVRQLQKKYLTKSKSPFLALMNLEKAFVRVCDLVFDEKVRSRCEPYKLCTELSAKSELVINTITILVWRSESSRV